MSENTVEIRLPEETTATGGKCWAKHVTSIAAKAKTGHDWQGDWAQLDRLMDANHGDVFVVGGSHGSRKNQSKCATLWIVDAKDVNGDGSHLVKVERDVTDGWAIALRETCGSLLSIMDPEERVIRAMQIRSQNASAFAVTAEAKALADRKSRLTYAEEMATSSAKELLDMLHRNTEYTGTYENERAVKYGQEFADAYLSTIDFTKRDEWIALAKKYDESIAVRSTAMQSKAFATVDPERLNAIETVRRLMSKFGITADELK